MNNFAKVNGAVLSVWARILRETPHSRLILHCKEGSHRGRFCERIEREGIDPKRIEFVGLVGIYSYLLTYNRIDIALDTFPYAGGTTSCDTLWMGVPLVSLAGESPQARAGLSILSNIGLPELVAYDVDQYVKIALGLASDLPRLSMLRSNMRTRMRASPVMHALQFARDVEAAYREMWRRWCFG